MRKILILFCLVWATSLYAQKGKVVVEKSDNGTRVEVQGKEKVSVEESEGAARIRLAGIEVKVVDDKVKIEYGKNSNNPDKFRGHWGGLELGINSYFEEDYSNYTVKDFMDLRPIKSIDVRLNLFQVDFGIGKKKNDMGFITGLGLESKDFRFENRYTIENVNGVTQPKRIIYRKLKKSKLNVLYVTAPLLFEMQFSNKRNRKFHIGVGVEGGFRLSSHTKIKYKEDKGWQKSKDRNSFNLNKFKLDAQLRIGYRGAHLFFSYGLIDLFEKNKGPKLTPIVIGIHF